MRSRPFKILILLISLTLACSLPLQQQAPPGLAYPDQSIVLITDDPHALPTLTPFQPHLVTATATPKATLPAPSPTHTAIPPTVEPPTAPAPVDTVAPPAEGVVNILVLGSDLRPQDPSFRTDIILWVAVNKGKKTVSVISFPRDLWVYVPGVGMQRINTSQEFGGFAETQLMFQTNFGYRPDHYMLTSFSGFINIIDLLGGIDVDAAVNLTDSCDIPGQNGTCSVGPGVVHMDSKLALWYVRSRYSTSDIDRGRRAQEVLLALFRRLISLDALKQAPQLFEQLHGMVETDLSIGDFLPLLPVAAAIGDGSSIYRYSIGYSEAYDWTTVDGARVLVPYPGAIQAIIAKIVSR